MTVPAKSIWYYERMANFQFGPDSVIAASVSEDHGIEALNDSDREIYSVGISTGGVAEMRMAANNLTRHVIAATIDNAGLEFARKLVEQNGLGEQIDLRLEDVTQPLPHPENGFDYIYARLVLHYLSKQQLPVALNEIYRIAKPDGRLFVVVRSTKSHDMHRSNATTDPETMLTTYTYTDPIAAQPKTVRRYFHTPESISGYLQDAGFSIDHVNTYQEHIYVDFMREHLASEPDNVIEILATKSH